MARTGDDGVAAIATDVAFDAGVEVARSIADGALEADGDDQARYDSLYRILWALDRVSEGLTAASEFVQANWAKPEISTS